MYTLHALVTVYAHCCEAIGLIVRPSEIRVVYMHTFQPLMTFRFADEEFQ